MKFYPERPKQGRWLQDMARAAGKRSSCRLEEGCVLVDERGALLAAGYRGRGAGLPNCLDHELGPPTPGQANPAGWSAPTYSVQYPNECPAGRCEAVHAVMNALLFCADTARVVMAYCTHAPCLPCVRLLLNTGCRRIVFEFVDEHGDDGAASVWAATGHAWVHAP